jgi:hypothetical protein
MQANILDNIIAKAVVTDGPTDLTISCSDGRRFGVHKSVLCSKSFVLAKMCGIDMSEKHTGIIEHKEFDSDTVELMVQYAYTKIYLVTKRPARLSLLEKEHGSVEVDRAEEETMKEETETAELDGENDSGKGVRSDVDDAAAVAAKTAAAKTAATAANAYQDRIARVIRNSHWMTEEAGDYDFEKDLSPEELLDIAGSEKAAEDDKQDEISGNDETSPPTSPHSNDTKPDVGDQLTSTDDLVVHARVYGLAEYYDMAELRRYAQKRFMQTADNRGQKWSSLPRSTLVNFIDVVREVGARTLRGVNDPLRNYFLELVVRYATELSLEGYTASNLGDSSLSDIVADMFVAALNKIRTDTQDWNARGRELRVLQANLRKTGASWEMQTKVLQMRLSEMVSLWEEETRGLF